MSALRYSREGAHLGEGAEVARYRDRAESQLLMEGRNAVVDEVDREAFGVDDHLRRLAGRQVTPPGVHGQVSTRSIDVSAPLVTDRHLGDNGPRTPHVEERARCGRQGHASEEGATEHGRNVPGGRAA